MGPPPRYAPDYPDLPKPWRALIDGNTGYIYFWNPQTNLTQYHRPTPTPTSTPTPSSNAAAAAIPTTNSTTSTITTTASVGVGDGGDEKNNKHSDECSQLGTGTNDSSLSGSGGHGIGVASHPSASTQAVSPEAYRSQHEITVIGDEVPMPFTTFQSTGFPSEILREISQAGFSAPTPIQAQSWPIALKHRDIVAVAKTGSGKTLGYLIPGFVCLKHLQHNSREGPTVLVLSPTRELATQIQDEAIRFGKSSRISSTCLYGGAPKGPQLKDLDRGADVVVATPGRLNDILEMRRLSLHQVAYLVLDEADRMLDMGFEPQIRKIVNQIPPRRQTLMFTATWPKEVRKIASDLLVNPVQVNIGNTDQLAANKSITQYVEVITPMEKSRRLEQILRSQQTGSRVIIFCSTKRMCDQLARNLTRHYGAAAIHGDKSQSERDSVLSQFRTGRSPILVATDVAARGLDIKDIRVVINYDFPTGVEDYVHRIGRTGRAGATGAAYTFFCDQDSKYASDLVKILEGASQDVPSQLRDMVCRGGYGGKPRRWGNATSGQDFSYSGAGCNSSYAKRLPEPSFDSHSDTASNKPVGTSTSFHARFYGNRDSGNGNSQGAGGRDQSRSGGWSNNRSRSPNQDGYRGRSRSPDCSASRSIDKYGEAGRNSDAVGAFTL